MLKIMSRNFWCLINVIPKHLENNLQNKNKYFYFIIEISLYTNNNDNN